MPLALDRNRRFDEKRQRALVRYYAGAGAGGLAVAVHSTQFEIREPGIDLFEPVLQLASETIDDSRSNRERQLLKIAGVCGRTDQALKEAEYAATKGYHAALLSLAALRDATEEESIAHCRAVAEVMPLVGFYLQPAVGGRVLPYSFWRRFAEIDNVLAVKIAPFNRYQTLDVVRAVAESGRVGDIALYTGNDDNIVADLLTPYRIAVKGGTVRARIVGGLLGHWAVWTKKAVELLDEIHDVIENNRPVPPDLLERGIEITDSNAAFFDVAHSFAGCIPGIHAVLRDQGLMAGTWCLNPAEVLSPGQQEEIDRVRAAYPHLADDEFVSEHVDEWLA